MPWIVGGAAIGGALLSSEATKKAADQQTQGTGAAVGETKWQYDQTRTDLQPYRQAGSAALTRLQQLLGLPGAGDAAARQWANEVALPQLRQHMAEIGQPLDPGWTPSEDTMQAWMKQAPTSTTAPADSGSLLSKFSPSDLAGDTVYNSGLQFGLDEGTKAIERRAAAGGGYDSGAELKALTRFGNDYGSAKAGDAYSRFTNDQDRTFGKLSGISGMGSGATSVGVNAGTNEATNLSNLYTGGANAAGAASIAGGNALAGGLNSIGQYAMLRQLSGGGQRTLTPSTDSSMYAG